MSGLAIRGRQRYVKAGHDISPSSGNVPEYILSSAELSLDQRLYGQSYVGTSAMYYVSTLRIADGFRADQSLSLMGMYQYNQSENADAQWAMLGSAIKVRFSPPRSACLS